MILHRFLLLLLFGILLLPTDVFACGELKKSCCKKDAALNTEQKSCCEKDNKSSGNHDDSGCNSNCQHPGCKCATTFSNSIINFTSEINLQYAQLVNFFSKRNAFLYTLPSISDGHSSLWLIPKISKI